MNEFFGGGTRLLGAEVGQTLVVTMERAVIPTLVLIMLSVTGVAVVLGCLALARAGVDGAQVLRAYFWIVFWTGLSEGISLAVGIAGVLFLARRIARPLKAFAAKVDAVAAGGGAVRFSDDTNLVEVKRLAESFDQLFSMQERRLSEMRDLSSHVLHDIKAPIARIRNAAELVFLGKDDAQEASQRIAEACGTVLALVETNAAISRICAGADRLPTVDIDMSALIRDAVDLYSGIAEENSIQLVASLPDAPLHFEGHPHRLQGLVVNLLENALKYTECGGLVKISALRDDAGVLVLSVSDTGIGIPPEAKSRIFERFYRVDSSRHKPGYGLGLSLVHAIVMSYDGTIDCDSTLGSGTTFTIRLPRPSPGNTCLSSNI